MGGEVGARTRLRKYTQSRRSEMNARVKNTGPDAWISRRDLTRVACNNNNNNHLERQNIHSGFRTLKKAWQVLKDRVARMATAWLLSIYAWLDISPSFGRKLRQALPGIRKRS